MEEILEWIQNAYVEELQEIMQAIEKRYQEEYPDWNVIYVAVPTDPVLRREKLESIIKWFDKDIQWHTEKVKKDSLG